MADTSFKELVKRLLKRAKLTDDIINNILNDVKYMNMFKQSFVHKTYDRNAKENYEKVETIGDLVLNMAIVNYIINKYPHIQSAHWLSNMKHRLISGKSFSSLAETEGFYPHIKMGREERRILEEKIKDHERLNRDVKDIKEYRSLLEDVFEAFSGTLQLVINDMSNMVAGPGYAVCYEFISSFLDQIEIPTTVEEVFDPISRVKEVYDSQGWPNKSNEMTLTRKVDGGDFQVTYVIKRGFRQYTYLGSAKSRNKKEARREAAINTLKILKDKYGLQSRIKGIAET